jgi:molybdopterin molybdotransferase
MITVSEAEQIIHQQYFRPTTTSISLDNAVGRVLAEDVRADRDLPPFNRATMDGIAIAYSSFQQGTRQFKVKGIQPAGVPPMALGSFAECIEIMTGGVVPNGADAIVRYEDLRIEAGMATIQLAEIVRGQNIHRQGADASRDAVLLSPSQRISPAEVALLASLGHSTVKVFASPRIAVVSTGDELVPVDAIPKPWQVRISNAHALVATLGEMELEASHHHISDNQDAIYKITAEILNSHDVVILSGGVSKGKFDYVPSALAENGIEKMFHEVSQRPGKPLWFGRGKSKTVFALPGNPVSTFMCFHRYVKPWLESSLSLRRRPQWAKLAADFQFKPALTYFLQVNVRNEEGALVATPDVGGGSGDFANLRNVDGFLELPQAQSDFRAGEVFPYHPFRR